MFEDRLGGDIRHIKGKGDDTHSYFQRRIRHKDILPINSSARFNEKDRLNFKIVSLISKET